MTSHALEYYVYQGLNYRGERRLARTPMVLITRFNLWDRAYFAGKHIRDPELWRKPDDQETDEMLEIRRKWEWERLAAFNGYCLPSIVRQAPRPDRWYVLFDEIMDPIIEHEIKYLEQFDWISPIAVPRKFGFTWWDSYLPPIIRRDFPDYDRILLFRFDSDDSLAHYFFDAAECCLLAAAKQGLTADVCFLSFPFGIVREKNDARVFMSTSHFMFTCQSASVSDLVMPYSRHKAVAADDLCVEILTERPMWCLHQHGANIGAMDPSRFLPKTRFADLAQMFYLHQSFGIPADLPCAPYTWLDPVPG